MLVDNKAQVLQRTDIVELIGQSVALKRRGKDFVGLCPFHQEKTPSFHVSPAKQFFYCYGCKAGGNAIDFVMKRDRVEFKEALEVLARKAGIELVWQGQSQQKTGERQQLLEAQSAACRFFENLLAHPEEGRAARDYLAGRGFNDESIRRFQIGQAADSWDALVRGPVGKKFPPAILALGGLIKPRNEGEGYYDTFRNRIMFPIKDEGGRIIGFGGRVMPGSTDPAKYLNSPETPLFSKSRCIFGLDAARQRIGETRTAVVVEGYTDVVMAHQFGVNNVVAALGTALTEHHVAMLRRWADRIVLLFDADTAGDLAVNRVVQLFLTQPVEIAVASMPAGRDPDEFLLEQGAAAFEEMIKSATDALSYAWKQLHKRYVASGDLTGQQKAVSEYLEMMAAARGSGPIDAIRWGQCLARVERLTGVPLDQLHRRYKGTRPAPRPAQAADGTPVQSAESPSVHSEASRAQVSSERWLLGVLLSQPHRWSQVQAMVGVDDFVDPLRQKLAKIYWDHQRDEGEPVFNEFLSVLDDVQLRTLAVELVEEVESFADMEAHMQSAVKHLGDVRRIREEQHNLAALRRTAEQPPDEQVEIDLLRKVSNSAAQPDTRRIGPRFGL